MTSAGRRRFNGLAAYLKVLYAPVQAFALLNQTPMWGWAAVAGTLLTMAGTILLSPATLHNMHILQQQELGRLHGEMADQFRIAVSRIPDWAYVAAGSLVAVAVVWLLWFLGAVVLVIVAALGHGRPTFLGAWVIVLNSYLIGGLSTIVNAAIILAKGLGDAKAPVDLYAIPSPAAFVHGSPKLALFLYGFNVFYLWYYVVVAIALEHVMKMRRAAAVTVVIILALLGAALASVFARWRFERHAQV
jgi:hypothetical protein